MPDSAVVIRYPDGDYEYIVSPTFPPMVGMTIERKNARWVITEMVESAPVTIYIAPQPSSEDAARA